MIELVTNKTPSSTHLSRIKAILENADEVYIAVAFLKMSGIKPLLPYFKKKIPFKIIAGANFGITEPEALTLLQALSETADVSGYLNKLGSKVIFHPKMYLIKEGDYGHIFIGSANLTGGGLDSNHECSLYHKCLVRDKIWKDALAHFNECILPRNADQLSGRVISIYRDFYKRQKKANDAVQEFPDVEDNLLYDLTRLKSYFNQLSREKMLKDLKAKESHYLEARKILETIRTRALSPRQFKILLENLVGKEGELGYWYSNGMFRHKGSIFKQQEDFRELVASIKRNLNKAPAFIYSQAKQVADRIKGVGPNFIGEIMMSYAPDKLANINRNPITVLRVEGKADIKDHSQRFKGEDYQEYNGIVKEIGDQLGLKNMLETDYFFNEIYQQIKAEVKAKGLRK